MEIKSLEMENFKGHKKKKVKLKQHNILFGKNGDGKTSILEALELFFNGEEEKVYKSISINKKNSKEIFSLYKNMIFNNFYDQYRYTMPKNNKGKSFKIKVTFENKRYIKKTYNFVKDKKVISIDTNFTENDFVEYIKFKCIYFKKEKNFNISLGEQKIHELIKVLNQDYDLIMIDEIDTSIHNNQLEYIMELIETHPKQTISTTNSILLDKLIKEKKINSEKLSNVEEVYFKKVIFLVEGKDDKKFLDAIIRQGKYKKLNYKIFSIDGQEKSLHESYWTIISEMLLTLNEEILDVFCFFDYDESGKKYHENFAAKTKKKYIKNQFYINGEKYIENEELKYNFTLENYMKKRFIKEKYKKITKRTKHCEKELLEKEISNYINSRYFNQEKKEIKIDDILHFKTPYIKLYKKQNLKKRKKVNNLFIGEDINKTNLSTSKKGISAYKSMQKKIKEILRKEDNFKKIEIKKREENIVKKTIKTHEIDESLIKLKKEKGKTFIIYYKYLNINKYYKDISIENEELKKLKEILNK